MSTIAEISLKRENKRSIFLDVLALIFIYFVPTISHLLSLPIYYIEPMRIVLILALTHTTKQNAFILALTLPLFSFLISAHPVLPKMILITFELNLNVYLFFLFAKKLKNNFTAILLSIIASKLVYYIIKFGLIEFAVLKSGLISTPILIQAIMILLFSSYIKFFIKDN